MKIIFSSSSKWNHYHKKGFAPSLVLKMRVFTVSPLTFLRRLGRYCVELHYGTVLALQLLRGNWVEICSQNNPIVQFDTTPTPNGQLHSDTCILFTHQPPVVQKLDNSIHRINRYPEDKYYENQLRYPLDSNLSRG